MKTPKKIRDREALSEHKNREAFQKWLRTEYHKDIINYRKTGEQKYSIDNVCVEDILYTMDEYDHNGQYVTLSNMRNEKQITINTDNRYKNTGYSDAIVSYTTLFGFREGINYLD